MFFIRLEMLMGVGSSLQRPCLAKDQELDGGVMSRLFSQKVIWLRPFTDRASSCQKNLEGGFQVNGIILFDERCYNVSFKVFKPYNPICGRGSKYAQKPYQFQWVAN